MDHSIKINRACRAAKKLPRAEAEILSSIPGELVRRLTAAELTLLMHALDSHWHKAREFERKEILDEGAIWDHRSDTLREIA